MCPVCEEPFVVSRTQSQKHFYCSDICRVTAWRKRRDEGKVALAQPKAAKTEPEVEANLGLPVYHKVAGLIVNDQRLLLISSGMDPGRYSLPGARMDDPEPSRMASMLTLERALRAELGVAPQAMRHFGNYEVTSNIDGGRVAGQTFRVDVLPELDVQPRSDDRSVVWVTGGTRRPVTTLARAVLGDLSVRGVIE